MHEASMAKVAQLAAASAAQPDPLPGIDQQHLKRQSGFGIEQHVKRHSKIESRLYAA